MRPRVVALPAGSNCGLLFLKKRSKFQTTASASSGVPSWKRTPARGCATAGANFRTQCRMLS
jgi:hypothetical protein